MMLFWLSEKTHASLIDLAAASLMGNAPSSITDLALRRKLARGTADPDRRARDGRPPSEWLRSLNADELRIWLQMIEVPEVGVGGMTFWIHLTRDHSFSPERIQGLTVDEQAKLHSAAHYGY